MRKGQKHSAETLARMSAAKKGKTHIEIFSNINSTTRGEEEATRRKKALQELGHIYAIY